jgi:hypothetical protein
MEVRGLMAGGRSVLIRPVFSTEVDDIAIQQPRSRMAGMDGLDERVGHQSGRESERPGQETERPDQNSNQYARAGKR